MAVLNGVMTNLGREILAKSFGAVGGFNISIGTYFEIGEGGYIVTPSGNIPKDPDPSRTALEATGAPGDYKFQKYFGSTDVTFVSPSTIQFRCQLLPTEANDDGLGNDPKFFEIGIFDGYGKMIAYATFDEQTKNVTKTLILSVQIVF